MRTKLEEMSLEYNPFEPAATGAPVKGHLVLPERWDGEIRGRLERLLGGRGPKVLRICGEYGSGKTYILHWLERQKLPERRIEPYYLDNPGVQFYDLANALLGQIGRKDFAKLLWELLVTHVGPFQRSLFAEGFEEYLRGHRSRRYPADMTRELQEAVIDAGITRNENVAYCLARIVAEFPKKPYFEYRDFAAGRRGALVAEKEEPPYFAAILATLRLARGTESMAFLIDEFEEISLQKKLTKRGAHDYLATLKRLINFTIEENLLLVLAMTPEGLTKTRELDPALESRSDLGSDSLFEIPQLSKNDARSLVKRRLEDARREGPGLDNQLYPFPPDFPGSFEPGSYATPRRIVKICFQAIANAEGQDLPFSDEYLASRANDLYPVNEEAEQP